MVAVGKFRPRREGVRRRDGEDRRAGLVMEHGRCWRNELKVGAIRIMKAGYSYSACININGLRCM